MMDEKLGRNNLSRGKEIESYKIGVENKMGMTTNVSREAMVMVEALDTPVTKEDDEIGQMCAFRCNSMDNNDKINEREVISLKNNKEKENTNENQTNEVEMVNALDTHKTEDEKVEIGEVFTIMNDPEVEDDKAPEKSQVKVKTTFSTNQENVEANTYEVKIEVINEEPSKDDVQTFECTYGHSIMKIDEEKTDLDQLFWARATTATKMETKVSDDGAQYAMVRRLNGSRPIQLPFDNG